MIVHGLFTLVIKPSLPQSLSIDSHLLGIACWGSSLGIMTTQCLTVTGGGSVGECGRLNQFSWLYNIVTLTSLHNCRFPCFENPYQMDLHESPVTSCLYFADCPHDLIPAFYSVGCRQKKTGYSEKVRRLLLANHLTYWSVAHRACLCATLKYVRWLQWKGSTSLTGQSSNILECWAQSLFVCNTQVC